LKSIFETPTPRDVDNRARTNRVQAFKGLVSTKSLKLLRAMRGFTLVGFIEATASMAALPVGKAKR
jgi:hypothetical protein